MHLTLATLVTALYAFTSGSIHGNGNERLGLSPVLPVYPVDVANAFTDAVLPFATYFTSKVFGGPMPSRTIDTGQDWDPLFSSSSASTLPPASPVYSPALPLPGPSPCHLLLNEVASIDVNAFDISPTAAPDSNEDVADESSANEGSNGTGARLYIRAVSLQFRNTVLRTTGLIGQAGSYIGLGRDFSPVIKDAPTPTTNIRMDAVLHAVTGHIGGLELASDRAVRSPILDVFSLHWTTFISRLYGACTATGIIGTIGITLAALVLCVVTRASYLYIVTKRRSASRTMTTDGYEMAEKNVPSTLATTEVASTVPGIVVQADEAKEAKEAKEGSTFEPTIATKLETPAVDIHVPADAEDVSEFHAMTIALPATEGDGLDTDPANIFIPEGSECALTLSPEDNPLADAVVGEVELVPGGENALEVDAVDVAHLAAGEGELGITLEDDLLPSEAEDGLVLDTADVLLPEAEDDELALVPEYVPLPEGAENKLGLAREDELLPERESGLLDFAIVLSGEVREGQMLTLLPLPSIHELAPAAQQLPARSAADDAHPIPLADADGEVTSDNHTSAYMNSANSVCAHASLDANTDEDADSWIHSGDALIASRSSTFEEDVSRKVTSGPEVYVFAGVILVVSPVLNCFDAIPITLDAARLAPPQSDAVESPRALASALELENISLPIPPAEYDVMDSLFDEVPPFDLSCSDVFDDIAHLAVSEGVIPRCRPCKFVSPADWEDGEDYIALALSLRDGCEYEGLLNEGPCFELPPSDSFDDIVHVAVVSGVVPPRPGKFCAPADWEDGEDYVALALLDGGSSENLLDEVPPFDIVGSVSFDDILYCTGDDVPPFDELFAPSEDQEDDALDGDEFGALEFDLRKFEEEDGEDLLEMTLPSLPSVEVIEEYAVPLFCRMTRGPMERVGRQDYLDEPDTSTASMNVHAASPDRATLEDSSIRFKRQAAMKEMVRECEEECVPLERMQFSRQRLALDINCLSPATSMSSPYKDRGKAPAHSFPFRFDPTSIHSRTSAVLEFERESTPGFDFDADSPGPRTSYSRERSPSESPSPCTPSTSFDSCGAVRCEVKTEGSYHGSAEYVQAVKTKRMTGSLRSIGGENIGKDMLIRQLRVARIGDAMVRE